MGNEVDDLIILFHEPMRGNMEEYEREIVLAFLKDQMRELKNFVERIETEKYLKNNELEDFFHNRAKREKKVLRTILH